MRAFITGSTGFIGTNLTEKLLQEGWQIRALVRDKLKFRLPEHKNLELIEGDLADQASLDKGVNNVDIVFNLAAGLPYHNFSKEQYTQANVEGVKNLLKASKKGKIKRLVHISTVGIYGPTSTKPVNEQSKLNAKGLYPETKLKGEQLVKESGLPFTIIRPTIGYGPQDTRPGFLDLFRLIKKRLFFLVGDGSNYFHTIYVENLIDALILSATKREAEGEGFIIGDEICPTMRELVLTIAKVEGVSLNPLFIPKSLAYFLAIFPGTPLTDQRVTFITENRRYSIDKSKKILGYKPKYNLSEGIKKTYDWYTENGYLR